MHNPTDVWTSARLLVTIAIFACGVGVAIWLILTIDRSLLERNLKKSGALEWQFSPAAAKVIADEYRAAGATTDVLRGVALDSFLLVPCYVGLIACSCFWAARVLPAPWAELALILGWGAFVAGGLDVIENAGIVAALVLDWSFVAPLTAAVCRLKWALVSASCVYPILTALYALVSFLVARTSRGATP